MDALASAIARNSTGFFRAFKDLYSQAENDGLDYERDTTYEIPDASQRMADFLAKLGCKG